MNNIELTYKDFQEYMDRFRHEELTPLRDGISSIQTELEVLKREVRKNGGNCNHAPDGWIDFKRIVFQSLPLSLKALCIALAIIGVLVAGVNVVKIILEAIM